jgi:hypothetical protein
VKPVDCLDKGHAGRLLERMLAVISRDIIELVEARTVVESINKIKGYLCLVDISRLEIGTVLYG